MPAVLWENPELISLYRLPMHAVPHGDRLELDGTWQFELLDRADGEPTGTWREITVPGAWTMQDTFDKPHYTNVQMPFQGMPPNVPEANPTGIYERTFELPQAWAERRIVLQVGAAESLLIVHVNGHEVGLSKDSHLAAEFDVTDLVQRRDENTIRLRGDQVVRRDVHRGPGPVVARRDHPLGLPVCHRPGPPGRDPGDRWPGRGPVDRDPRVPGRGRLRRPGPTARLDRRDNRRRTRRLGRTCRDGPGRGRVQRPWVRAGHACRARTAGPPRLRRLADGARGKRRMARPRSPDRSAARRPGRLANRGSRCPAMVRRGARALPGQRRPARPRRRGRGGGEAADRLPPGRGPRPRAAPQRRGGPAPRGEPARLRPVQPGGPSAGRRSGPTSSR